MRLPSHKISQRLREASAQLRRQFGPRPRDLRRDLGKQAKEEYWQQRCRLGFLTRRVIPVKEGLESSFGSAIDSLRPVPGILRAAVTPVLIALFIGLLFIGAAIAAEFFLVQQVWRVLVPSGESAPPIASFPRLAVEVTASLLGFYLASVSIVLSASYQSVSSDVRELVLGTPRVKVYLATVGMAIGAGLTLVLLQSGGFSYGYITIGVYTLVVIASGWAFVKLAYGAFSLFNPAALSDEPLSDLFRSLKRLNSKRLKGNEKSLQDASERADRSLRILAELVHLTSDRVSVDRGQLAGMVRRLLWRLQYYAQVKHALPPTSTWFMKEASYPRWVEANQAEVSIALNNSVPLRPKWEPSVDWLERRSAELAASAIEACVEANDTTSTLSICRGATNTTYTLARCHRIDEAFTLSKIVRDRCWNIQVRNDASVALAGEPALMLSNILLGWEQAISDWPNEIKTAVVNTKWDNPRTVTVRIRGSQRVWESAQLLLGQVKAEREVQGQRAAPNRFLKLALATDAILSIRETAKELPGQLNDFLVRAPSPSPEASALSEFQALQTLEKAQLVADSIPAAVGGLDGLRSGNDPQPVEEIEALNAGIRTCRTGILQRISTTIVKLKPANSKSDPDLFGQGLFTLVHHTEEAIATGNIDLVEQVFPNVLKASFDLQQHLVVTYQEPAYHPTSAIFDPTVDILELSGLAMAYAVIQDDDSDAPIVEAWIERIRSLSQPTTAATSILNFLDQVDGGPSYGISPRSVVRTEWEMKLTNRIVEVGYAVPETFPLEEPPEWNAPRLIKLLGVHRSLPSITVKPRAIFAAEVIAPLSEEPEEILRTRPSLRRYFDKRDFEEAKDSRKKPMENEPQDTEVASA